MRFTEEQLNTLSAWEDNFRTAVNAQWARNPGRDGLRVIYDIYTSVTGDQRRFNDNCNHCILSLLQDCGRIYFQDKEEQKAVKACIIDKCKHRVAGTCRLTPDEQDKCPLNSKEVQVSQEAAEPVKKVEVKTRKRTTKKSK